MPADLPLIVATWTFAQPALAAAWPKLSTGGSALDAVEDACDYAERDLSNHTVGLGGWPDRDGHVSLDAAIMLSPSQRGGVCSVTRFGSPIKIARAVMERTPHALLAGPGAEAFAEAIGMLPEGLLTPEARERWEQWRTEHVAAGKDLLAPGALMPNFEELKRQHPVEHAKDRNDMHDTIGVIAIDSHGQLASGCSTSGLPWKLPGRVGDSPLLGQGLYCVPNIGAAVCTGHGELVMGTCAAFLAVETLRHGATPQQAADTVIARLRETFTLTEKDQVGIIVVNAKAEWAAASVMPGFKMALRTPTREELITV